jgi:ubiquinone/menaquinone biosynthesis C-methylase UbiE
LDRVLYRHPFEGQSARRYAMAERPAFGDLDDRLLDRFGQLFGEARTFLDVGCGPATFPVRAAARHPRLAVIAIDPSRDFTHTGLPIAGLGRARGEALPLADGAIDVALCLSSIRHVRDRITTFCELRRVIRPGGSLLVVELDPAASRWRIANHANRLGSALLRPIFGPLVVRTAPTAEQIEGNARSAGWRQRSRFDDPLQPVYVLALE